MEDLEIFRARDLMNEKKLLKEKHDGMSCGDIIKILQNTFDIRR
jgi:hypothetical protein